MSRVEYNILKKKYDAVGKGNVRLTQSTLKLLRGINPATTSYRFDVLENEGGAATAYETRLNINDEFNVSQLGLYIAGNILNEGQPNYMAQKLWTFSPLELSGRTTSFADFWNGKLKILVNNIVQLEKWDIGKHNYIPRGQFIDNNPSFPVVPGTPPFQIAQQPHNNYIKDGMAVLTPMITLSGAKKNDIIIELPQAIIAQQADWITEYMGAGVKDKVRIEFFDICLIARGFLAQNAAKFQ